MTKKTSYIYAVCGDDKYIETLNFSLSCLKKFTKNEILIITDKKRNKSEIEHDNIISINTPEKYNNHQASIFLKTSLHKYIERDKLYCYIDSDVIAVNSHIDKIFDEFNAPVTFCSDHTRIHEFSPYAINCNCLEQKEKSIREFMQFYKVIKPDYDPNKLFFSKKGRALYRVLYDIKNNPIKYFFTILRFLFQNSFGGNSFRLNKEFHLDLKNNNWQDVNDNLISNDPVIKGNKYIEKNTELKFDRLKKYWKNPNGQGLFHCECDHLVLAIKEKFNVDITAQNWQHWNGGVFLFSKDSVDFMDHWHDSTMEIFDDPKWHTRDQGTLAATAWKFELHNHKLLPVNFNFLTNFYKPEIQYSAEKGFTKNNFKTTFEPYFLHIYDQFGNKEWDIWQRVEKLSN